MLPGEAHKFVPSNNPRLNCARCPNQKFHPVHVKRHPRRIGWKRIFSNTWTKW